MQLCFPSRIIKNLLLLITIFFSGAAAAQDGASLLITAEGGGDYLLTEDAILALPQVILKTHTVWTEGLQTFEGPLARDVLGAAGVNAESLVGKTATLHASNDYTIEIPAEDFILYDVIIAKKMNGISMTLRDKGPYWVIYPRDEVGELTDSRFDHRWVWQLAKIKVE